MKDYEVKDAVVEIKDQDLEGQEAGAGARTAIEMTTSHRCGVVFTLSYECSSNHVSCG